MISELNVRKLGEGPEARVEVTLLDGRKFKGSIREATDDMFLVVEEKTNYVITFAAHLADALSFHCSCLLHCVIDLLD